MGLCRLLRHSVRELTLTDPAQFRFDDQSVPARYDERLVPRLFHPWAEALVGRLAPERAIRALDVATGPGTVARVLAKMIGAKGQVAACDASPSMIARAEGKGPVARGAPIAYTVGPAVPLPYPADTFQAVTCQQGLQFFPDGLAALTEIHRVLVPGGRLALSVWHPLENCPVPQAYQRALQCAGQPALADLMRIPHPHWTGEDLTARARQAGFGYVQVLTDERDLVFPGGIVEATEAYLGTPIGPLVGALPEEERARIAVEALTAFAPLLSPDGVRGPMRAWVLLATA